MIIECPACRTRFRLDETKIRGRGARVRCRRCGEGIVVMKPEGEPRVSPAEPADRMLDLAAAIREPTGKPPQAAPPAPAVPPREPEPAFPAEAAPAAEAQAEAAPPVPESAPEPGSQPAAEPAAPEPSPFAEPASSPRMPEDEVDLAFDRLLAGSAGEGAIPPGEEKTVEERPAAGAAPAPEAPPPAFAEGVAAPSAPGLAPGVAEPPEPPGPAIAFAEEERIAFAPEEPAPPQAETPEGRPFEIMHGLEEQMREGDTPAAGAEAPAPEPHVYGLIEEGFLREEKEDSYDISAALQARPDIGLAEEVSPAAPAEPLAKEASRADVLQEELTTMGTAASRLAEGEPSARLVEPPAVARPPVLSRPEGRIAAAPPKPAAGRPFVSGLIALFLVLAAGGAWLGFTESGQETLRGFLAQAESWLPGKRKAAPAYAVSNVIGYYETGARAGKLFVIKGQVTNVSHARKHGIQVVATLLDARGMAVARQAVYAGNALSGDFLRQSPREKIEGELSNPVGRNLQNIDIPPGKAMPFTAVFFDAPDGIDAYRLEAKDGV